MENVYFQSIISLGMTNATITWSEHLPRYCILSHSSCMFFCNLQRNWRIICRVVRLATNANGNKMMNETVFTIAHISDLHFSHGTDMSAPDHAHSIPHLRGLESKMKIIDPDILIVSGDVSNHGDRQSLINASTYLYNKIGIGGEEYTGLNLSPEKLGIVPGNHDAWNASKTGTLIDRRQNSLENYNYAFPSRTISRRIGCYYDWIENDGLGLYIAYVDSCFLGDTEKHSDSAFGTIRFDQAVAKGKLSVQQAVKLLEWYDLGCKGSLQNPRDNEKLIGKTKFANALKIIVMHHYLFEPPEHKSDYFMRVQHRDIVFRNLAFADFDILLCGHKHFPSFDVHTYGQHFDRRAKNRYLINCFRRLIGLYSLPMQIQDNDGHWITKAGTTLIHMCYKLVKWNEPDASPQDVAGQILSLLKQGLEKPNSLEKDVKNFISMHGIIGTEVMDDNELKEIQKRLAIGLSAKERKELTYVAKRFTNLSKKLVTRSFLQILSGSTAKACAACDKERTFNVLKIAHNDNAWNIKSERYVWDWTSNEFLDNPLVQNHNFPKLI